MQTGTSPRIPIILVGTTFWSGLSQWFEDVLVENGTISPEDMDLFTVIDKADEVVDAIFKHYEQRGFEPSEEEQEALLLL